MRSGSEEALAGETVVLTRMPGTLGEALLQETRLLLLALLGSTECHARDGFSLQELGRRLDYTPQNIHHHLKVLEAAGMARVARTERTQRIPRQFWTSDVRSIALRPVADAHLGLEVALPKARRRALEKAMTAWAGRHRCEDAVDLLLAFGSFLDALDEEAAEDLLRTYAEVPRPLGL